MNIYILMLYISEYYMYIYIYIYVYAFVLLLLAICVCICCHLLCVLLCVYNVFTMLLLCCWYVFVCYELCLDTEDTNEAEVERGNGFLSHCRRHQKGMGSCNYRIYLQGLQSRHLFQMHNLILELLEAQFSDRWTKPQNPKTPKPHF